MCKREVTEYALISRWLHWIIAVMVMMMLLCGFFLEDVPAMFIGTAFMLHKSTGLTIFLLMIIRIAVILACGKPPLPTTMPTWQVQLSQVVQHAFYVLLILMPLCGWVMSTAAGKVPVYFNWIQLPFPGIAPNHVLAEWMATCHQTIAWILIALVCLHIAAAFKHYFIDKDQIVKRMSL